MARIDARYVSWKVLLDGVEVPWVSFTIGVGVDTAGTANVVLEPDPLLYELRPTTMVHIFMYDNFEESADEDDKYKLFWEGEAAGYAYSKSAQSRAHILNAEGTFSIFGKSKMYGHGFGPISNTPIITGSAFYQGETTQGQLFNLAMFGKTFGETDPSTPFVEAISYAERMVGLIAYLSSYNALLRLQAVRNRVFCKIASISDRSLGRLIPKTYVYPWSEQIVNSKLPEDASVLDAIGSFNRWIFHHFVSISGPSMPKVDRSKIKPVYFPARTPDDNLYAFARTFFRNDYLLMPELYYAVPPSCNYIFPEFFQSIDLTRQFNTEATRAVLMDTHIQGSLQVIAPDTLLRFSKAPIPPAEFWNINKNGLLNTGTATSPYHSKSGNQVYNLLAATSDLEIEKGIVTFGPEFSPFEYFSGVSNVFSLDDKQTQDRISEKLKDMNKMSLNIFKGASKESTYAYMMQAMADYQYNLARFRRSVTLELTGHRWIVPGFPCVIFDTLRSYIGYVKSYSLSVSQNGQETGGIVLDYVRPFPKVDVRAEQALKEASRVSEGLDQVKKDLSDYTASVKSADSLLGYNYDRIQDTFNLYAKQAGQKEVETSVQGVGIVTTYEQIPPEDASYALDPEGTNYICSAYNQMASAIRKDPSRLERLGIRDDLASLDEDYAWVKNEMLTEQRGSLLSFTGRASADERIKRMVDAVGSYYRSMIEDAENSASSGDPSGMTDSVLPNRANPAALKKTLTSLDLTDKFPDEFFAPPIFGNFDFMEVQSAEKIYQDLIGARPFLTQKMRAGSTTKPNIVHGSRGEHWSVNNSLTPSGDSDPSTVLALRSKAYSNFTNFSDTIQKIFPVLGGSSPTEWGDKIQQSEDSGSVRTWEEARFLRRINLQSLKDFVETNGLKKTIRNSSPPTPQAFTVLEPKTYYQVGDFVWDDSIYSKIVDEFRVAPRDVTITKEDGSTESMRKSADPVIDDVRKSVKLEMLTTKARQDFWIQYASEHFGSRAISSR